MGEMTFSLDGGAKLSVTTYGNEIGAELVDTERVRLAENQAAACLHAEFSSLKSTIEET